MICRNMQKLIGLFCMIFGSKRLNEGIAIVNHPRKHHK